MRKPTVVTTAIHPGTDFEVRLEATFFPGCAGTRRDGARFIEPDEPEDIYITSISISGIEFEDEYFSDDVLSMFEETCLQKAHSDIIAAEVIDYMKLEWEY